MSKSIFFGFLLLSLQYPLLAIENVNALVRNAGEVTWDSRISGTSSTLYDIHCPTSSLCVAVGGSEVRGIGGVLIYSVDGGVTWKNSKFSDVNYVLFGVHCPTTTMCVAVGNLDTIVRSIDGGATWDNQISNISESLNGVYCPTSSLCVAVGWHGAIIRSTDRGVTWNRQVSGTENRLLGIHCPTSTLCITVGETGTLVRSIDGGKTWNNQSLDIKFAHDFNFNPDFNNVYCSSPLLCIVVGNSDTLFRSIDGGITWIEQTLILGGINYFEDIHCLTSDHCIVVDSSGRITHSNDGGVTWKYSQDNVTEGFLYGVYCSSKLCFVVGNKGIILANSFVLDDKLFLPSLGRGVNVGPQISNITTTFIGGGATKNNEYHAKYYTNFFAQVGEVISVSGMISVDNLHVGEKADIIVVFGYKQNFNAVEQFYMLDIEGNILPWDTDVKSLEPFKREITLTGIQSVDIYKGTMPVAGTMRVYFGYRLLDGTIIFNGSQAIEIVSI